MGNKVSRGNQCKSKEGSRDMERKSNFRDHIPNWADVMTSFSLDLYKQAALNAGDNNVLVSPSSVFIALAMVHAGARNNTLAEMTSSLNLQNRETPSCYDDMGKFFSNMMESSNMYYFAAEINCANRLYPNKDKDILETYMLLVERCFGSTIKPLDFKMDPEGSRKEINDWVEEQTKQKIKDLLPGGSITSDTGIVLVNAIYFKASWSQPFLESFTKKQNFSITKDTKIQVDMMFMEAKYIYGISKQLKCKVLKKNYENGGYNGDHSFVVLLPNEVEGLKDMESKLTLPILRDTMSAMVLETVIVSLPKFRTESSFKLKPALQALGIRDAFVPEKADFSGIGKELFLSEVFHKTFVDVNEKGTEAAAADTCGGSLKDTGEEEKGPKTFTADHPFLYMIWVEESESPLFIGRYCCSESSYDPLG